MAVAGVYSRIGLRCLMDRASTQIRLENLSYWSLKAQSRRLGLGLCSGSESLLLILFVAALISVAIGSAASMMWSALWSTDVGDIVAGVGREV